MKYCVHIIFYHKKVLLLKRHKNNPFYPNIWTPVIGKIKVHEAPKTAVLRETYEETRLAISQSYFLEIMIYDNDEYFIYYSKCNQKNIVINHENYKFDFFNTNELPDNLWAIFKTKIHEIEELTKSVF